jgi:hypothetical protein
MKIVGSYGKRVNWTAPLRADSEEREVLRNCVIYC